MGSLRSILRIAFNVIVVSCILGFFGNMYLEGPPFEEDPYDLVRGLSFWGIVVLIVALNELLIHRKRKNASRDA